MVRQFTKACLADEKASQSATKSFSDARWRQLLLQHEALCTVASQASKLEESPLSRVQTLRVP